MHSHKIPIKLIEVHGCHVEKLERYGQYCKAFHLHEQTIVKVCVDNAEAPELAINISMLQVVGVSIRLQGFLSYKFMCSTVVHYLVSKSPPADRLVE